MEDKVEKLSAIKRAAIKLLDSLKEQIANDCSDDEVAKSLAKFSPETNGYFKQDDFVTADKAMKMLHLGYNRAKFFALTKEYGIENHKISNQNVGFLKKDIERLCVLLDEEVKAREKREKRRSGQRKFLW
jgi:hypothetical protein